jgi:energy-coupling factor transport system substrate-specific component
VTIAILSALGGVLSAYVGYLANVFNSFVGTPFGAGQFLAGLHVFWLLLARGMTRRAGSATLTGLLKGTVEMMAGSVHGVLIVLVSLVEGAIADLLLLRFTPRDRLGYMIAGGFSTASNVLVFQLMFLSGAPLAFIAVIGMMAFASGVIFAGYFSHTVLLSLTSSGLIGDSRDLKSSRWRTLIGYAAVAIFLAGSLWYYGTVYTWSSSRSVDVNGLVGESYSYREFDFQQHIVTVEAELRGSYMQVEPRNFTGVPLSAILERADPLESASEVRITASDGYAASIDLELVMRDPSIIVVDEKGKPRLVGDGIDGSLWVRDISTIELV